MRPQRASSLRHIVAVSCGELCDECATEYQALSAALDPPQKTELHTIR